MQYMQLPTIDMVATGKNIHSLRVQKGLSVKALAHCLGFEEPQAVYKWQWGQTLPSVDNLYALSYILGVPMESILVPVPNNNLIKIEKQQEEPAASAFIESVFFLQSCFQRSAL